MHSDLRAWLDEERRQGRRPDWKITGLDGLFPDVGPVETSKEPLDQIIERAAKIIKRWWRICDGEAIDTSAEIAWRRSGVIRETAAQCLPEVMRDNTPVTFMG